MTTGSTITSLLNAFSLISFSLENFPCSINKAFCFSAFSLLATNFKESKYSSTYPLIVGMNVRAISSLSSPKAYWALLIKGNNIYSPETCIFVPQTINNLIIKRDNDRGELPIGVWYDSSRNKFKAYCCNGKGKVITIGRYQTVEEAFNAYKLYKENVIKSIADEYINYIPYMLYEALYNYNVDIDD